MNDRSNTSYDPDKGPEDNYVERLIDEADYRREERKNREMEKAMERDEARVDRHGRTNICNCGAYNVWSKADNMWYCSADIAKFKALHGTEYPL